MARNLADRVHNGANLIDSRDVIARIAELESDLHIEQEAEDPNADFEKWLTRVAKYDDADVAELLVLRALQEQAEGYSDFRDGETLIRDGYFEQYAQELAEDIGAINRDATWPNNHIDWEAAADALKADYTSVDYDGVEYWIRG